MSQPDKQSLTKISFTKSFFEFLEQGSQKMERFFERNIRLLAVALGVILLFIIGYFVYLKYVLGPKEIQAQEDIQMAISAFEQDSLKRALGGGPTQGANLGFVDLIEQYSGTKTQDQARLFAAAIYYKQAKYKDAIKQLESFSSKDPYINTLSLGMIGDCFMELDQNKEGYAYYQKAIDKQNTYASPIYLLKKGVSHLVDKQPKEACKAFEEIENKYLDFYKEHQVEKLLVRAKAAQ